MIIYLAGLLSVAFAPTLKSVFCAVLLLPILLLARYRFHIVLYLLGIAVAACYGAWQIHHRLPLSLDRQDIVMTGYVVSLPEVNDQRARFIFKIDQVESSNDQIKRLRRIRLNAYRFDKELNISNIRSGDFIRINVRLRSPHFLQNPDAFDLERHFLGSGWDASGTLREVIEHYPEQQKFYAIRDKIRAFLTTQFLGSNAEWLLPAIILGDRTAMNDDTWRVLQKTGTAHLLVVSGLHIAVMSGSGFIVGRLLLSGMIILGFRSPYLRIIPLMLAFILATIYAFVAGFNLPVQRAWLMVSVFLLGELSLFHVTAWQRWRLSLLLVMSLNPLAMIEPGAWMSFVAVAVLLLMTDAYRVVKQQGWITLARAQWMIFVGLMPVMAMVFQQFGILAPFINLLAIPLFSVFVMALPLMASLLLLDVSWIHAFLHQVLDISWLFLSHAADIDWATVSLIKPTLLLIVVTLPLWLLLLIPLPFKWKWIGFLFFIPLLIPRETPLKNGDFRAIVFDVGQGLAVIIETSDQLLMYDTGPGYPGGGSAWGFAIAPWFKVRNQLQLSRLVISHNDLDHSGGLSALQKQLEVLSKDSGSTELIQQGFNTCHSQAQWNYNHINFRYLTHTPSLSASENERSCILEVRSDVCSLLLTGDAGHANEYDLIRNGQIQSIDWLVAGHHGSASSSSKAFIDYVDPNAVIYTAGYKNRYGHPATEVVQRFRQQGADQYNTATDGAVFLEAINGQCKVSTQRQRKRRYWTSA